MMDFSNFQNSTDPVSNKALGFSVAILSGIGYGINFLPIKKFETGDGMFFQWITATAIFIGSFIVHAILNFPKIVPLVLVGGVLWSLGNLCTVPIVKRLGIGLGLLLWSCTSIVVGWASSRFGWFGINKQVPNILVMNYIGFAFIALSPIIYGFVKPTVDSRELSINILDEVLDENSELNSNINDQPNPKSSSSKKNRLIGFALSLFAGTMYGLMFIPVTFVKNRYPGASQKDIDYLLSQCLGIYLVSTVTFVLYCCYRRNLPIIHPNTVLPGFGCGSIWFLSYVCFFLANEHLDPVISQPIIGGLPGIISILIATIYFREIKGIKNYVIILVALTTTITGITLTALSKIF